MKDYVDGGIDKGGLSGAGLDFAQEYGQCTKSRELRLRCFQVG